LSELDSQLSSWRADHSAVNSCCLWCRMAHLGATIPLPLREQLCTRYCSSKHTHGSGLKTHTHTHTHAPKHTQTNHHSLTHLPWIADRATFAAVSEPTSLSGGLSALKPTTTIDAPCGVCALASSLEQSHVHIAETCLGNRPQEASDELLDTRVKRALTVVRSPMYSRLHRRRTRRRLRQRSSRSGRRRGPTRKSPIQTSSLTPGTSHTTPWMTIGILRQMAKP
jgi:hypothetical protein